MEDLKGQGLVSLDDGDWQVAEGEADVRGWDVITADRQRIGEVDDLLADPSARKVVYMTIDLDRDMAGGMPAEHVRVPIGRARVNEVERKVILDIARANITEFATAQAQPWRDDEMHMTRAAEELRVGTREQHAARSPSRRAWIRNVSQNR